jgi:hypothetical protein
LVAAGLTLGALTRHATFFVVAAMAGVLLSTSLSTSRVPLTRTLGRFTNQVVEVRLWGASPPDSPGGVLVLDSVNIISVGVHVFFKSTSGRTMHLKVAQPFGTTLSPDCVLIESAKYVQWNGAKLKPVSGSAAMSIQLGETFERVRPGSVA